MKTEISERICQLIDALKITRSAFGEGIGISSGGVTALCNGRNNPSNQSIMAMVKTYNVNEEWLRTGNGSMFLELTYADEVAKFCGEVLHADPDDPRMELMRILAKLPFEDWQLVSDFIDAIKSQK